MQAWGSGVEQYNIKSKVNGKIRIQIKQHVNVRQHATES